MEVRKVSYLEYKNIIQSPFHMFNSADFNELNKKKCDEVVYLLFYENDKCKLGFIGGIRNNTLVSPFSAPFGGFNFVRDTVKISNIESSLALLEKFAYDSNISEIKIALAPSFYDETFSAKLLNALFRSSFKVLYNDLDFYLDLKKTVEYEKKIWYSARRNLRIARDNNLSFKKVESEREIEEVYEVIKLNREFKGKPLNMTLDEILMTSKVIKIDYFLVKMGSENIASGITFHVNQDIIYVPFWGDRPGFTDVKPMNFITNEIFKYYRSTNINYVHTGISTEDGVPNYGLCEFKESIGCIMTPKFTFVQKLS